MVSESRVAVKDVKIDVLITNLNGRRVIKEIVEAVRRWREFADVAGMTI